MQIIDDRLVRLGYSSFKLVDFQSPDWICSSFSLTFKFAGLVGIANIHVRGELFIVHTNWPSVWSGRFCHNTFLFDCDSGLFASQASHFIAERPNNVKKSFDPRSRPLARRQEKFHGILIAKRASGQCAVETFNDRLVSVNVRAPMANGSLYHLFGHTPHELMPRVNLQQRRPRQRAALVNRLKSNSPCFCSSLSL